MLRLHLNYLCNEKLYDFCINSGKSCFPKMTIEVNLTPVMSKGRGLPQSNSQVLALLVA